MSRFKSQTQAHVDVQKINIIERFFLQLLESYGTCCKTVQTVYTTTDIPFGKCVDISRNYIFSSKSNLTYPYTHDKLALVFSSYNIKQKKFKKRIAVFQKIYKKKKKSVNQKTGSITL